MPTEEELDQLRTQLQAASQRLEEVQSQLITQLQEMRREQERLAGEVAQISDLMGAGSYRAGESAGGDVGEAEPGIFIPFMPMTGDLRLTHQSAAPAGWLLCDGTEQSKENYEKLYRTIGHSYGIPTDSLYFILPAATDLPAPIDSSMQWMIRI